MKRKIRVIHFENDKRQPIVTMATIELGDEVASGLAICSKLDKFDGKKGRKIALGRAFKALNEKESGREILRDRATNRIKEIDIPLVYKSFYDSKQ
jgi:hypothetical protein